MLTPDQKKYLRAIRHIVHEYANFVSSAEMVRTGKDVNGNVFAPPINTHVSHAFYLNCRKLADFFQSRGRPTDVLGKHYIPTFKPALRISSRWRPRIVKQLAHITYAREDGAREIKARTQQLLYAELRKTWATFRKKLPELYAQES